MLSERTAFALPRRVELRAINALANLALPEGCRTCRRSDTGVDLTDSHDRCSCKEKTPRSGTGGAKCVSTRRGLPLREETAIAKRSARRRRHLIHASVSAS